MVINEETKSLPPAGGAAGEPLSAAQLHWTVSKKPRRVRHRMSDIGYGCLSCIFIIWWGYLMGV
jgi:hypothetical protein